MHVYPEITSSINESWQTGKWCNEVPLEELSPMWANWETAPDRHFYVEEVACTITGQYILPKRWIVIDKKEYAEGHPVYFSQRVSFTKYINGPSLRSKSREENTESGRRKLSGL